MRCVAVTGQGVVPIRALVPETRRERMRGLRGAPRGAARTALFLERCRSVHTFGMRTTITVAFLDANMRVIRVVRASPGRVLFCRRARHVLECHVGADVRVGDVLTCGEARR